jgi:hypothetical protein
MEFELRLYRDRLAARVDTAPLAGFGAARVLYVVSLCRSRSAWTDGIRARHDSAARTDRTLFHPLCES